MKDNNHQVAIQRELMKSNFAGWDHGTTDQGKKLPYPGLSKEVSEGMSIIKLPSMDVIIEEGSTLEDTPIYKGIVDRVSNRKYTDASLTIEELSYLLYATQGVKSYREGKFSMRTVPSGGARHPFETYLGVIDVAGLDKGLYRYLPFSHELVFVKKLDQIEEKFVEGTLGQKFAGSCAVNFVWACIPYRCEWRYKETAHKTMLLDAGHICQNLYLACESIASGTCGIAAYDQELMDQLVGVDGEEEFVVYMAPVGKVR